MGVSCLLDWGCVVSTSLGPKSKDDSAGGAVGLTSAGEESCPRVFEDRIARRIYVRTLQTHVSKATFRCLPLDIKLSRSPEKKT